MAISPRQVKNKRDSNGILTGRPGIVYDVNIKYVDANGQRKTYAKRGFTTKKAAALYEAEKKIELATTTYVTSTAAQGKMRLSEYLPEWLESHKANIRPKTYNGYRCNVYHHIIPALGQIRLNQLSPQHIDRLLAKMDQDGLSMNTIRYCQRTLSAALTHASKYGYINTNPAQNITFRFRRTEHVPSPYTIEQIQLLLAHVWSTKWEIPVILAALYGLRLGEALGLKWKDVNLENNQIWFVDQLPDLEPGTTIVTEFAPLKDRESGEGRMLPITEITKAFFVRHKALQEYQKQLCISSRAPYYENDLLVCKADGRPIRHDSISREFSKLVYRIGLPHNTYHGLRRTAGSNIHALSGDYYTVSTILGHTVEGAVKELQLPISVAAVTSRYIEVQMDRKKEVLEAYHNAILTPQATEKINEQTE